jgi:hypothetical protein
MYIPLTFLGIYARRRPSVLQRAGIDQNARIDDGFSFCPAFLPPKTNLTEGVQDFRGYASFAAF